jgi:hypothetical protein
VVKTLGLLCTNNNFDQNFLVSCSVITYLCLTIFRVVHRNNTQKCVNPVSDFVSSLKILMHSTRFLLRLISVTMEGVQNFGGTITNTIEENPSKANDSYLGSQEICRLLWNRNFIAMFTRSRLWFPPLSLVNPVNIPIPYFFRIHFDIVPSTLTSTIWAISFKFSVYNFVRIYIFFHTCDRQRSSHSAWFRQLIMICEKYESSLYAVRLIIQMRKLRKEARIRNFLKLLRMISRIRLRERW